MTNSRVTYTIPDPERSMFKALAAKTGTSEAELLRRFIRWACQQAGVVVQLPAECVYIPGKSDSAGESSFAGVIQGDSGGDFGVTADG